MDNPESLMPVYLLLTEWCPDGHRGVTDGNYGLLRLALSQALSERTCRE